MGSQGLMLMVCAALLVTPALSEVWEFGKDAPGSIIVDHKEGDFTFFQKSKEFKLLAPQCYTMEYIRVQIDNPVTNPKVNYEKLKHLVTITYHPLQYSVSSYSIIAKAARQPGCYNEAIDMQLRNLFGK